MTNSWSYYRRCLYHPSESVCLPIRFREWVLFSSPMIALFPSPFKRRARGSCEHRSIKISTLLHKISQVLKRSTGASTHPSAVRSDDASPCCTRTQSLLFSSSLVRYRRTGKISSSSSIGRASVDQTDRRNVTDSSSKQLDCVFPHHPCPFLYVFFVRVAHGARLRFGRSAHKHA